MIELSSEDTYFLEKFGQHIQYVVGKYYKKVSRPEYVNEQLFGIVARMLELYKPEQRQTILETFLEIANGQAATKARPDHSLQLWQDHSDLSAES